MYPIRAIVRVKLYLLDCNLGVLVDDAFREAFFDILRDKLRDAFRDVCFDTIRTLLACSLLLRCFERATPWLIVLHLKPAEPTIFCYFISNASIFKQRLLQYSACYLQQICDQF